MKYLLLLMGLSTISAFGQTPQNATVQLNATVSSNPPKISLFWIGNATTNSYQVFRKIKGANNWGAAKANLSGAVSNYEDTTIQINTNYEYQVVRRGTNYTGYGYINTGIEIPLVEKRGKMIVLIEKTIKDSLPNEITQLFQDLENDGWAVDSIVVSKSMTVSDVKNKIKNVYEQDVANTKALFMLGHIPVPYSGNLAPDGHPDHQGAWPCDAYYGELNDAWTDNFVNTTAASSSRHHNVPGDGKFDQTTLPGKLELQVGRVDFSNLPAFNHSEIELTRRYLQKAHAYKYNTIDIDRKAIIDDNFGYFGGEVFSHSGWNNFSTLVGPTNVASGDYFTDQTEKSYLWSYGCGGGTYVSAGGVGSTTNFAQSNLKNIFTMLFGSYFGDWDSQNNFLRAALAQGNTLTNMWAGRPHYHLHHMSMGENIGFSTAFTQNNNTYFSNYSGQSVHMALMGDPSLRNQMIDQVSDFKVSSKDGHVAMKWKMATNAISYQIYVKRPESHQFEKLKTVLATDTIAVDSCVAELGMHHYMIRSVHLVQSHTGTYYDMSMGNQVAVEVSELFKPAIALADYSRVGNTVTFINQSSNALNYLWTFPDGSTSTEVNPIALFSEGSYFIKLEAFNECTSDVFEFEIKISLTTKDENLNFSINPNPNNGIFEVILAKPYDHIDIYNTSGIKVFEKPILGNLRLTMHAPHLASGVYKICTQSQDEKRKCQKLIILK